MTGIILHRPQFGGNAERVGYALGGALVVGRETYPHTAIVEDRVVRTIGLLDLIERLGYQEALQAVAGHERERRFEEVEAAEGGEFIEHQKHSMPEVLCVQLFGQPAADLIEHE